MHPPALVVLAAGMGSRYGGLKQLDPIGNHGETFLDYSVFDAARAGFGRIVFVIRREFADEFQCRVLARYAGKLDVLCVFQELDDLPPGFSRPALRIRPWGTLHAVLAARQVLNGFFAVVNADDFYGCDAYQRMAAFCRQWAAAGCPPDVGAMLAYNIRKTLSPSGGVNRGICRTRGESLESVVEMTDIHLRSDGKVMGRNAAGQLQVIVSEAQCSMNFWGLTPTLLNKMGEQFTRFLVRQGAELTAECYLPSVIDELITTQQMVCRVLPTDSEWFGVTYLHDRTWCADRLRQLTEAGVYPQRLWL